MMRITASMAKDLIENYENLYTNDRKEWIHVRDADTKQIIMEVNVIQRHAKIYIDWKRNAYVDIDLPWDNAFMLRDTGYETILNVFAEGIKIKAIFSMEVVE